MRAVADGAGGAADSDCEVMWCGMAHDENIVRKYRQINEPTRSGLIRQKKSTLLLIDVCV